MPTTQPTTENPAPCRLCDGHGCDDCSSGREYCEDCPGHLLHLAAGFFSDDGEESEPFEVRARVFDAGTERFTRWIPESRLPDLLATCLRVGLRLIETERRESNARALCESHRAALTRVPTAEDWRDVRADLAWDGAR